MSLAYRSHSAVLLKVVFGAEILAFLLKVSSTAKFADPPLNVPMISIKTSFLNKPIGSFPLYCTSVDAVDKLALAGL